MRPLVLLVATLLGVLAAGQDGVPLLCKNIGAVRTSSPIAIDGVLTEADWRLATPGIDFVQNEPRPNEPASQASSVHLLYDDVALYVGAQLYDPQPDSVMMRLSARDAIGITDWFGITLDPYNSGLNGFEFIVTSAGVQFDAIVANEEEDENWNAVWQSGVARNADGWAVEMRIPYSAFRFPKEVENAWSVQFLRLVGRNREKSFWNPIDPLKEGWLRQCGTVSGISGIMAPLRLMLYPYVSGYVQHFPTNDPNESDWTTSFNGGMDVKLGLSDAYTLDMTLIPDFGQVVSDNVVLNLSPFEVQFNENRQFFTEGTELFQRGGLFYSRRIGGVPLLRGDLYNGLGPGESVVDDPGVSKLLNATKISGRGASGLGLGMLNAVTRETHGSVRDSLGAERRVLTDPLTNYNVLVADQLLPNNGYVSLINTNVMRDGGTYDANSSALDFLLNNKARTVQGGGVARVSQQFGPGLERSPGYAYTAFLQKTGGSTTYALEFNQISDDFDPNDLGFWQQTNFNGVTGSTEYIKYKPKSPWQRWGIGFETEYLRVVQPDHFFNFAVELNTFWILKGFNAFGGHVRAEPVVTYDPFEARVPGRLYAYPTNVEGRVWISTNYNKPLALDMDGYYRHFNDPGDGTGARDRKIMKASFDPRIRPNDRTFVILNASHSFRDEDLGWVAFDADSIILGRRDLWTTELGIEGQYIFNNRMALTLRARHYWSRARYVDFHRLLDDGYLTPTAYDGLDADGQPVHDVDFDAFTVDLIFRWNFAPGSEMTLGWKDNIFTSDNVITVNYFDDLRNTWEAPGVNSFSLKVLYFIDAGKLFRAKMRTTILLAAVALTLSSCNLARMQHRLTEGRLKRAGYEARTFQAPDGAHHVWHRDTGKPKLLLLHGYTGTGQLQWSKTAQLLRKDYDVIMPDLLCHGKSTTRWSGFNFDAQVAHVALLLDSLGVKGPIPVVGNSYGGGVAAHLAEVRPERVSRLVLYDALVSDYTKALADSLARSVGGESMLAVMRTPKVEDVRFGLRLSLYRQWPIPKFVLRQAYDLNIKPYRAAQITLLEDLLQREAQLKERRYGWTMPVHLIWGERDRLIPNSTGLAILRRNNLPETHWHVIPRTGHVANIERPKAFVRELRAVLAAH